MLIQRELEAKVMSYLAKEIEARGLDVALTGAWQTSESGLVKWVESTSGKGAIISVALSAPQRETFSLPSVTFSANISLFVRGELDPTGDLLAAAAEVIQDALDEWQTETYQHRFIRFDLPGLSVDEIALEGAASPVVNESIISVTYSARFAGSYL